MKLTIINGSPRRRGATGQLLGYLEKRMIELEPGTEVEYVDLGKYTMEVCDGCLACYKTGHCHLKNDGLEDLSRRIGESDGLIIGSPTYASNVSSQCKILIDRGHFVFEQLLRDTPCFSLVTYENAGGGTASKVLNSLIRTSGGSVCAQYRKRLNHGADALDAPTKRELDRMSRTYLKRAKKGSPLSLGEKAMRAVVFRFGLVAHAKKNPTRYQAILERWNAMGLA